MVDAIMQNKFMIIVDIITIIIFMIVLKFKKPSKSSVMAFLMLFLTANIQLIIFHIRHFILDSMMEEVFQII